MVLILSGLLILLILIFNGRRRILLVHRLYSVWAN